MRRATFPCSTRGSRLLHGFFMTTPKDKTPWLLAVERAVRAIPRGQTASYARVALMAGKPGAARAVVRALHALDDLPWWRVIRSDGTVAPQVAVEQRKRLKAEGVTLGRRARAGSSGRVRGVRRRRTTGP